MMTQKVQTSLKAMLLSFDSILFFNSLTLLLKIFCLAILDRMFALLSSAIYELVNEAYDIENGENSKYSFKKPNQRRLSSPKDELKVFYDNRQLLKAELLVDGKWRCAGACAWKIIDIEIDGLSKKSLYFGPFAVKPSYQGRKVGKALMECIDEIAKSNRLGYIDIMCVNHRIDLQEMYQRLGYKIIGRAEYPFPYPVGMHISCCYLTFDYKYLNIMSSTFISGRSFG